MSASNPFGSLFGKSPLTALQRHMRIVVECTHEIPALFEALAANDQDGVATIKDKIFEREEAADKVKNEMRGALPKSLFMPVDRRDLLDVLQMQDSIADTAQDSAGLLIEATDEHTGGEVAQSSSLPLWILVLGGTGIVVGLATMGYRVMQTIGTNITELTPSRGYCAMLAAAATVVLASRTGLPVLTTHIAVGAVVGVGLARGVGAIDLRVIGGIVVSWVVTLPAGGILAALILYTLKGMFS